MKKETYQDLYRQYMELSIKKGESYYLHCTGELTDEQYKLFTIHMNCQLQHIENGIEQVESFAQPIIPKSPSIGRRLLSFFM